MNGESSPASPSLETAQPSGHDHSTPLLETLFTKQHRKFQPLASLILGIAGVALFAIGMSFVAGELIVLTRHTAWEQARPTLGISYVFLVFAAVYPPVVMTLQLFATCQLPVAVRLLMVIALMFACVRSFASSAGMFFDSDTVLVCLPICAGGFIQRWRFRWSVIGWGQTIKPPGKLSIATLLDWTAAFAVVLAFFASLETKLVSWLSMTPLFLLMAAGGMHAWGRLAALCQKKSDEEIGVVMWITGNTILGCLIFLFVAFSGPRSTAALISFVVAPGAVLIAQLVTAVPIAWLRACGWKLVRQKTVHDLSRADVQFLDLSVQCQGVVDEAQSQQSAGAQE